MGTICPQQQQQIFGANEYVNYLGSCYGEPQVVSSTMHEGDKIIVNEYTIDRLVPVPKLQTTETLIEKTIVIPQVRVIEELVDVPVMVREKIVEVAKPIVQETLIEQPEREYREEIIIPTASPIMTRQPPQFHRQESYSAYPVGAPRMMPEMCPYGSTIVGEPVVTRRSFLEPAPEDTRVEFPPKRGNRYLVRPVLEDPAPVNRRELVVPPPQAPELSNRLTTRQSTIPRIVFSPECFTASAPAAEGPNRNFACSPPEQPAILEYTVPKIKTVYKKHFIPIHVPRFIEKALAAEQCNEALLDAAANCDQGMLDTLASLGETDSTQTPGTAPTLGELDQCWQRLSDLNFDFEILHKTAAENIMHWWNTNQLLIDTASIASVCAGVDSTGEGFIETVSVVRKRSTPPNLNDRSTSSDDDEDESESDQVEYANEGGAFTTFSEDDGCGR